MKTLTKDIFTFSELSDSAQDRAIEGWRDHTARCDFDSFDIESMTDSDYWQEEKLSPLGITITNSRNGNEEVYWSTNPSYLVFGARIDVPVFMRACKMAGKYRALYNAALAGDIDAYIDITHGYHASASARVEDYVYSRELDAQARIDAQIVALEEHIQFCYDKLTSDWIRSIEQDIDYRYSEEYIREQLTECYDSEQFDETGELVA